jgi:hypothetical protein
VMHASRFRKESTRPLFALQRDDTASTTGGVRGVLADAGGFDVVFLSFIRNPQRRINEFAAPIVGRDSKAKIVP